MTKARLPFGVMAMSLEPDSPSGMEKLITSGVGCVTTVLNESTLRPEVESASDVSVSVIGPIVAPPRDFGEKILLIDALQRR